jgi:hypothetical protein
MYLFSTAASALGVLDVPFRVVSVLAKYAQDARHVSVEKQLLAKESFALSTLLEILVSQI